MDALNLFLWLLLALLMFVSALGVWLRLQKLIPGILSHRFQQMVESGVEQRAYHNNDEFFRAIFESAPECVKLQNRQGVIERINFAGLALLETDRLTDIQNRSVYELIGPDYHAAYRDMTEKVFAGAEVSLEYEMTTFSNRRRWMRTNAVPLRDVSGRTVYLIAITHDITENRLLSRQMEQHRNQLQTIIESEPECVKLQDANGVIMEINPAGLHLLDAERAGEIVGRTVYEFITAEYQRDYRRLTDEVFAGSRGSMEFEVVSLNGYRRWLETHAAPLCDSDGQVIALLAITRDIDERKRNEARLYQQQIELARVCRLSTMGEMASSLAHELNQPLCAVSSYAESARQLNTSANVQLDELLSKIVCQSQKATQIIRNVRDFVRKQTPCPKPAAIQRIVRTVIDFVEPDRERSGVCIDVNVDDDLPVVRADQIQMEQVLLNLVGNAIQAMRESTADQRKICINITREGEEELLFQVCNTGPDIPHDVVAKLFTPFYTTKKAGMGMGLAISRSIVEAHGGRIWYQCEKGVGPSFCFTLPIVDEH